MKFVVPTLVVPVAALVLMLQPVRADGRAEFITCQAMIEAAKAGTASASQDDAALQRCRQIVRDWTLRESRMTVDEQGRPLR
jgi:hypothetical protein